MKDFLDQDFLLENDISKEIYHSYVEFLPIIDFHNHLDPKLIYENINFQNISDIWLGGDHYKWRALRTYGVSEEAITGKSNPKDKFYKYCEMLPYAVGNPLYHWSHLELKRYFDIDAIICPQNADQIYELTNKNLQKPEFSTRNLLRRMNVKVLCTTDDPISNLEYHQAIKNDGFEIKVLPTFRPEKVMAIEKADFNDYIQSLSKVAGVSKIENLSDLENALLQRLEFFAKQGCVISDHSLNDEIFCSADRNKAANVFCKALNKESLTKIERTYYKGYILSFLGKFYHKHNWVMQIHIGALRNNSDRMFKQLGPDSGFDSVADFEYADQLSSFLNYLDKDDLLPKTILYTVNGKDYDVLSTMIGNFQSVLPVQNQIQRGHPAKIQFGPPWWFLDHKVGFNHFFDSLTSNSVFGSFIGMLTDSRSFLSFPRHEYFRRLLCNYLGNLVNNGEYPNDIAFLGELAEDICYYNIRNFLDI